MTKALPSLLLTVQLLLSDAAPPALPDASTAHPAQEKRMMWGLIDPELAAWFALLPGNSIGEDGPRVLWDWSWQGFLAALFGDHFIKEVPADGAHV